MHVLHKHARHHPHPTFLTVNPGFTLPKPQVYPTQTPPPLRPIWKCINMQDDPNNLTRTMGTTDHFSRQMKMKQKTFKLYQSAGLQKMIGRTIPVI